MDLDAHANAAQPLPSSRFAAVVQKAVSDVKPATPVASPAAVRPAVSATPTTTTINNTIAWLSNVNGRDKFYRTAHFILKDLAWIFENVFGFGKGNKSSDTCDRIANGLMQGRRFFRIGSAPAAIQGILAARREEDDVLRMAAIGSRVSSLVFLVLDHCSWFSRQGFFGMDYNHWVYYDCLFWLVSIVLQLIYDRRAFHLAEQQQARIRAGWFNATDRSALEKEINALEARKRAYSLDFIRNLLDLPLALNGIFRFSRPTAIVFNLIGTASALAGSYQTWPK